MADITNETNAIANAIYGEQVRGAIIDALEAMNEQAQAAEEWATGNESGGTPSETNNAQYYAEQAAASAAVFAVDPTLSSSSQAAQAASVGRNLREFNAADLFFGLLTYTTTTDHGVTFTWSNGVCTLTGGTSTHSASCSIIPDRTPIPNYIIPGQRYSIKFATTNSGTNYVYRLCFSWYDSEDNSVGTTQYLPVGRSITIPENAAKWRVFLYVVTNVSISGTVTFSDPLMMTASTNAELQEQIDALAPDSTLTSTTKPAQAKATGDAIDRVASDLDTLETIVSHMGTEISDDLYDNLVKYNAYDLVSDVLTFTTETRNGVTYTWSGNTCTMTGGTGDDSSYNALIPFTTPLPPNVIPGKTYKVLFDTSNTSSSYSYRLRILYYGTGNTQIGYRYLPQSGSIVIPEGTTRWFISLYIVPSTTITGAATFSNLRIMTALSNTDLEEKVDYDGFPGRNVVPNNTDLNTVTTVGRYFLNQGYSYTNAPYGSSSYGMLLVYSPSSTSGSILQIAVDGSAKNLYFRQSSISSVFSDWTRTLTPSDETVIDDTLSTIGAAADAKATGDKILKWYSPPAAPETWGLSDMPRSSYTFADVGNFTNAPEGMSGYGYIVRRPFNLYANMSLVLFIKSGAPNDFYYGKYVEGYTFAGWIKLETQESVDALRTRVDVLESHDGNINLANGNYRRANAITNGIHYTWDGDVCRVWGTATSFSANVVINSFSIPTKLRGKPVYVKFRSSDRGIMLRISYNDGTSSHNQYYNYDDRFYVIPEDAVSLSASIYVNEGTVIGSEAFPATVSGLAIMTGLTNVDLTEKYNTCDPEKPVYVAIGMSTVIGAVHYYTSLNNDTTRYSKYNYPDYTGEVLGLETHNLAIGGTGLICRTVNYDLQNHMDVIYNNDALLSRASLITLTASTGNDSMLSGLQIGSWDDYYPYDKEGYHPSGGDGSALLALGATWCGALNWCIRWLGTHYPKAQLILLFGSTTVNNSISVSLNNDSTPTKIVVTNGWSQKFKDAHTQFLTLVEKLNIAHIDPTQGMTYTPYSTDVVDANGDYVLWSTIKNSGGVKEQDGHPNDEGYHLMARQVAGQIASLFYR